MLLVIALGTLNVYHLLMIFSCCFLEIFKS